MAETATLFAFCPNCATLYLDAKPPVMCACRRPQREVQEVGGVITSAYRPDPVRCEVQFANKVVRCGS